MRLTPGMPPQFVKHAYSRNVTGGRRPDSSSSSSSHNNKKYHAQTTTTTTTDKDVGARRTFHELRRRGLLRVRFLWVWVRASAARECVGNCRKGTEFCGRNNNNVTKKATAANKHRSRRRRRSSSRYASQQTRLVGWCAGVLDTGQEVVLCTRRVDHLQRAREGGRARACASVRVIIVHVRESVGACMRARARVRCRACACASAWACRQA